MMHGWNGGGWAQGGYAFGFPWGSLTMGLLALALIALVIVQIVRMSRSGTRAFEVSKDKGLDILTERFARGEIDAEAFRLMKAELDAKA